MGTEIKSRALFFDRDGIVNVRPVNDYVKNISEFSLIEDFIPLFSYAHQLGYLKILISNQQGVGKGLMTAGDLQQITDYMQQLLYQRTNTRFDGIYYCSDLATANSLRRKPRPGMILEAIADFKVDTTKSWMVGDAITDAEAGRAAGVNTILIGDFPNDSSEFVVTTHVECLRLFEQLL